MNPESPAFRHGEYVKPELTQVTSAGAGYIVIQNVPTPAVLLLKNKEGLGMDDVQVVCLNYCTFELTISLSEGAAEGLVGAMPFTPVSIEVPGQQPPCAIGPKPMVWILTRLAPNFRRAGWQWS